MLTRKIYLAHDCTHREYYGSIVAEIGLEFQYDSPLLKLARNSTDEHYNNIPMERIDSMGFMIHPKAKTALESRGDFLSLAGLCCIVKEALRQAIDKEK